MVQVVTRYVFGSKSKWVERGLTAEEMLQVFDFPPQVYSRWSQKVKLTALAAVRVPIKVLVAVASTINLLLGLQVGGGCRGGKDRCITRRSSCGEEGCCSSNGCAIRSRG